jgi:hypothetical protein
MFVGLAYLMMMYCLPSSSMTKSQRTAERSLCSTNTHIFYCGNPAYQMSAARTVWFCNCFAAAVLMPLDRLRAVLPLPQEIQSVDWDDAGISKAARRLHVSRIALAIRLENLRFAREGFSGKYIAIAQVLPRSGHVKDSAAVQRVAVLRLRQFGTNYSGRIFSALSRGVIDGATASQMLNNTQPVHFAEMRAGLALQRGFYGTATEPYRLCQDRICNRYF